MADFIDPDVKDELQAMAGAQKVPLFGNSRAQSKCLSFSLDTKRKLYFEKKTRFSIVIR